MPLSSATVPLDGMLLRHHKSLAHFLSCCGSADVASQGRAAAKLAYEQACYIRCHCHRVQKRDGLPLFLVVKLSECHAPPREPHAFHMQVPAMRNAKAVCVAAEVNGSIGWQGGKLVCVSTTSQGIFKSWSESSPPEWRHNL